MCHLFSLLRNGRSDNHKHSYRGHVYYLAPQLPPIATHSEVYDMVGSVL